MKSFSSGIKLYILILRALAILYKEKMIDKYLIQY